MDNRTDIIFRCPVCGRSYFLSDTWGNERLVVECECGKQYEIRVTELVSQESPYPIRQVKSWAETRYHRPQLAEVNHG